MNDNFFDILPYDKGKNISSKALSEVRSKKVENANNNAILEYFFNAEVAAMNFKKERRIKKKTTAIKCAKINRMISKMTKIAKPR